MDSPAGTYFIATPPRATLTDEVRGAYRTPAIANLASPAALPVVRLSDGAGEVVAVGGPGTLGRSLE